MSYNNKQYLQDLTKQQQTEMMGVDFCIDDKLGFCEIDMAYVLPTIVCKSKESWRIGGVLNSDGEYVEESGQYAYGEKTRVYGEYPFDKKEVTYIDEEVIYMNNFIDQWGHYLLDVIGRLWYATKNRKLKIVYSTYLDSEKYINGNFLSVIELLGIDKNRLMCVNEITQFKKVILPNTSILTAKYYTNTYKEMIDTIVSSALKGIILNGNRKVYCSRKHFSTKRTIDIGEDEIETVFLKNNYEIVYMEELSLEEQIRLLNDCEEIVCLAGTLAHNAIFIRNKNCNFTIINKTYKINRNIYLTNDISEANFVFIDSYLAPLPVSMGKGPYIVTKTNEFIEYCKDNHLQLDDNENFNYLNVLTYYYNYFKKYYRSILKGKKIGHSKYDLFDIDDKSIRKHYNKMLRNLKR